MWVTLTVTVLTCLPDTHMRHNIAARLPKNLKFMILTLLKPKYTINQCVKYLKKLHTLNNRVNASCHHLKGCDGLMLPHLSISLSTKANGSLSEIVGLLCLICRGRRK
eukprot:140468_1